MSDLSDRDLDRLVSERPLADTHFVAEATSSAHLTHHQREAAAALIDHTNGEILTWLKLTRSARSIEPILEQRSGSAHLSPSQIYALLALKDCPNDRLVACLEVARQFCLYDNPISCNRITDSL